MLLQNTSLYICSNSKNVVHGLLKIIQNYVNNKTVFFCFFSGKYKKYFFRKFSCFWVSIRIFVFEQKKNFLEKTQRNKASQNFKISYLDQRQSRNIEHISDLTWISVVLQCNASLALISAIRRSSKPNIFQENYLKSL